MTFSMISAGMFIFPKKHEKVELFLKYVEPEIPVYTLLEEKEKVGLKHLTVQLNYETGMPRPSPASVKNLVSDLAGGDGCSCDFQLPRGQHADELWAKGHKFGKRDASVRLMPYGTDFEVFGIGKIGTRTAIRIVVYAVPPRLPGQSDLIDIVDTLELKRGTLVAFYLPTMNPEAPPWAMMTFGSPDSLKVYSDRAPS